MADDSVWNKFKTAFDEPAPKPKTQVRELDPDKAKSFSSVFNSDDYSKSDAMSRRMKQIRQTN